MIQTARLVIRAPIAADFETFWRMNNDPEVKRYTGGVTALSREAALAQHEESCRTFDGLNPAECIFSVEERSAGRCIGCCGFEYSKRLGAVELAYGLREPGERRVRARPNKARTAQDRAAALAGSGTGRPI